MAQIVGWTVRARERAKDGKRSKPYRQVSQRYTVEEAARQCEALYRKEHAVGGMPEGL